MYRRRLLITAAALIATVAHAAPEGTIKVGSTPTGVPFSFLDTQTNTIQGIMVDLVTAIGKDAGFMVDIQPMQFSALIPALTSSKIDVIAAAMFATDARKQVIDFSSPVYTYGEGLIVPAENKNDYVTMADLKGLTVGAQVGTAFVEPLQKSGLFADVKIYDTIPDILRDVNVGRLQAGFADYPILAYNVQQGRFPATRLVRSYRPTVTGSVAIGVRKDENKLLDRINSALAKMQEDGSLKAILAKWGL